MFVVSFFTGTREDQYSDQVHIHLDGKVNSQNFKLCSHGKQDVVTEALLYLAKIIIL